MLQRPTPQGLSSSSFLFRNRSNRVAAQDHFHRTSTIPRTLTARGGCIVTCTIGIFSPLTRCSYGTSGGAIENSDLGAKKKGKRKYAIPLGYLWRSQCPRRGYPRESFPFHPPSRLLLLLEPRVGFRGAPARRRPARERTTGGGKNHRLLHFEPVVGWRGVLSEVGSPKEFVLSGRGAAGVPFEGQSVKSFTR